MTIGRIKEIKNVGVFADFSNGGSLGFEKLTFIYGLNTYGKTTLTDIFQSLKTNNPAIIRSRKTIPIQLTQQKVTLTSKDTVESDVKFEDDNWIRSNISSCFEIFGTDFIHKNLFTGPTIERANRESFTQFVLGEHGVKIAKKIAEKRKILGDKRRDLKTKIPPFVSNKADGEAKIFLELSIDGLDKEEIENDLAQKKVNLKGEKEALKEPQKILSLQEPDAFEVPKLTIINTLNAINTLLQEDYIDIKYEVLQKLTQHLDANFSKQGGSEGWIKSGLQYCKDVENGGCPFCGQSLKDVQDLMNIYTSYFDEKYNDFIDRVTGNLSKNIGDVENTSFMQKTILQTALTRACEFKELIKDEIFQTNLLELKTKIELLQEENFANKKDLILKAVRLVFDERKESPYKKVNIVNLEEFRTALNSYSGLLTKAKNIVNTLRRCTKAFKQQYEDISTMQEKIAHLEKEINELEYKKARIEQDGNCREYSQARSEIDTLGEGISKLQKQLNKDQSTYLERYFTQINRLFKELGSRNFTFEKDTDNTGHLPVYSLKVKFHNVEIPNQKLEFVFSESDRRALALAIFWARINLKNSTEKTKLIIILDDPVTSFDDNRVTNSINIFKDTLNKIGQMVILTHYPHLIKRFCEITKDKKITVKYLKIEQSDTTSFLSESNRDSFIMSDYEKVFMKIYGFVNKTRTESIKTDLRPFLEKLYLPTVFAKQIRDKKVDCSSLEKMIDGIFDDATIKTKLHGFRSVLNPDSHIFTSNNNEDVRSFASEMIDYLYSLNFVDEN